MMWLEALAVVFGLLCVWLTVRQNIWCWPVGLVQVVLYIFIFYQVKLYSDVILQVIYVAMQLYGWHYWLHGGRDTQTLAVTVLNVRARIAWPAAAIVGTLAWGFVMKTYTDAAVAYGDAFIAVTSLIAQWLMARKKLESWIFWIAVDVIAIGVYWYKDLHLTSGLYTVFLVLAALGLVAWRKSHCGSSEGIS